jgi:Uma2 family endonuclease
MELMSPRKDHESIGHLLGRLIERFSEVRDMEIVGVTSTPFRRADLQKGFEADEAYYVQNADRIRAKEAIDLSVDPPPNLVVEVETTNPAIPKLPLFAAMGIAEVRWHDGERLTVTRLHRDHYEDTHASQALPGFPLALADSALSRRRSVGETALVREFRLAAEVE